MQQVDQVFSKLANEHSVVVIATRKGAIIKSNRSPDISKKYAAWGASMCRNTMQDINEEVRLIRVNTTDSELTVSTIPGSPFLLVTVQSQKLVEPEV